jgi:hypothetical protein
LQALGKQGFLGYEEKVRAQFFSLRQSRLNAWRYQVEISVGRPDDLTREIVTVPVVPIPAAN